MVGKLFVYENIVISDDRKTVDFTYRIDTDEKSFNMREKIEFPDPLPTSSTTDRLLCALHLALGISYYKTFIPPAIDHGYSMDSSEAEFWNTIFERGLGEFLYKNKIDPAKLAKFKSQQGSVKPGSQDDINWNDTALLGVGGGKDSIVAGELLKDMNIPTTGFVLATQSNRGQTQDVVGKMGINLLPIKRYLDEQILNLNDTEGAYNGHIPISLIFALTGCLLATTTGSRYVIVANESSASIPQLQGHGNNVNHQWSKSLEFEILFRSFVHSNVSPQLHYTSIIRPLSSIAVAKIFSNYPAYFETFSSDNSLFKIKPEARKHPRWSHDSPKSLSSYILLAPWMSNADLDRTFGSNFLNHIDLRNLFLALLGTSEGAILDCVGTPEELRLSLSLLASQDRMSNSALMNLAKEKNLLYGNVDELLLKHLSLDSETTFSEELSQKLLPLLKEKLS